MDERMVEQMEKRMAELSDELKGKLSKAKSIEEIAEMLKAEGQDETRADRIWKELETMRRNDDNELSIEEMEAVSGGSHRDYWEEGCAATVEEGSDCWGTDGGCTFCNINYYNIPWYPCPNCNQLCLAERLYNAPGYMYSGMKLTCRTCGIVIIGY